jgi:putative transposase
MADRTAWRICPENGWWSRFGTKRPSSGKRRKAGSTAVHPDLVQR